VATPYSFVDADGAVITVDADNAHGPFYARSADGSIVLIPASGGGSGGGGGDGTDTVARQAIAEEKARNDEQDEVLAGKPVPAVFQRIVFDEVSSVTVSFDLTVDGSTYTVGVNYQNSDGAATFAAAINNTPGLSDLITAFALGSILRIETVVEGPDAFFSLSDVFYSGFGPLPILPGSYYGADPAPLPDQINDLRGVAQSALDNANNLANAFYVIPSGQAVFQVPEQYATIEDACFAARNNRRFAGPRPKIDVLPGIYAENFDSNGCDVVARSFPDEIVPSSYLYTSNNARNYGVQFTVPAGHGCTAGDSVAVRRTAVPASNDEARGFGDCIVTDATATTITIRFTGNGQMAGSAAGFGLYRYPIQNRRSQPLIIDGTDSGFDGVGFSPQSAPTDWGNLELLRMRNGARLILPGLFNNGVIVRPSLGCANANVGIRMDRGSKILGGRISLGSNRYENLVMSTGSEVDLISLVSCHGAQNVALYEGAKLNVQNFGSDRTNTVVSGGIDFGIYAITSSIVSLRTATVQANGQDIAAYVNALVSLTNVGGLGNVTPSVNSSGNRGAAVWS